MIGELWSSGETAKEKKKKKERKETEKKEEQKEERTEKTRREEETEKKEKNEMTYKKLEPVQKELGSQIDRRNFQNEERDSPLLYECWGLCRERFGVPFR